MDHDDAEDGLAAPSHWSRDEWLLMFIQGVPMARIAAVCRVPLRNVSAFIYGRLKADPWRRGHRLMIHDQPCLPSGARRPTWGQWCQSLRVFHNAHGRLPSFQASDPVEKSLISWIYGQRRKHRTGELTNEQLAQLNDVPGWNRPPKAAIEEDRWQQRLTETEAFYRQHGHWPRYQSGKSGQEKVLATWLGYQRTALRGGVLRSDRTVLLHAMLPGLSG